MRTYWAQAIARTIEGMERIREAVEDASKGYRGPGQSSKEIGQIVKVIDEVTKQTSLLALNAAILAAQAGEHGKGFSVVANEIKELAERTSASTEEITRLIKSVQQRSNEAVESMRQGRESVLDGRKSHMGHGRPSADIKVSCVEGSVAIETATTLQVRPETSLGGYYKRP
jgi:methyl-accepting chemotaxis protein